MAVSTYRELLRSCRQAFRNDARMLQNSQAEIRRKFQDSAAERDPQRVQQLVAEGKEAADFLRTYVVQASLNPRGNYEMQVEKHHAETVAEEADLR